MKQSYIKAILQNASIVLGLLALLTLAAEALARTPFVQSLLPAPSWGVVHPHFDIKLSLLEDLYAETGNLDCLYVGTSMVGRDIAPEVVSRVYQSQTGTPITCFNFGMGGITAPLLYNFFSALINRYQPETLVMGVNALEYSTLIGNSPDITQHPWIQYELGNPSLEGWLSHYSAAYQYLMAFRLWYAYKSTWETRSAQAFDHSEYGQRRTAYHQFTPLTEAEIAALAGAALEEAHLAQLERIAQLQQRGIQVVLLEMPLPPDVATHYQLLQAEFAARVQAIADAAGAAFIPLDNTIGLNPDDFSDQTHLHIDGAIKFSEWLGLKLASSLNEQPPLWPLQP